MTLITIDDLRPDLPELSDEKLARLIEDAEAIALIYAPCIASPVFKHKDAAKAIIRKAIVYDVNAQEDNSVAREATGPYNVEYRTPTRSGTFFSKDQKEALARLCPVANAGMYSIELVAHDDPAW